MQTKLYDYQKQLIYDDVPFQQWNKARQIGFSFAVAFRGYRNALKRNKYLGLYMSVGQRQSTEILDKIRTFMLLDQITPEVDKNIEIQLPNGSRLISLPQNPATARGYDPDELFLDEFAHYKKDKQILTALMPSMSRKTKDRTVIIGSTPFGKSGEFWRLWDTDKTFIKNKVDIHDAVKMGCPVSVDDCRRLCPDETSYKQEYLCDFVDEAMSMFPYDMVKHCWNADLGNDTFEQLAQRKGVLIAGYDPAKLVDSGVFTVVEMMANKRTVRHIKEWRGTSYTQQLNYIEEAMKAGNISLLRTDRTGVGEKLYEDLTKSLGSKVEGITFTNDSKEKMIIDLKVIFQDNRIEIPYNMTLVNQLHGLQRQVTEARNVRYTHETGKHDDYVWSLALACMIGEVKKSISVRFI